MKGNEGLACILRPHETPINTGDSEEMMKGEGLLRNPIL